MDEKNDETVAALRKENKKLRMRIVYYKEKLAECQGALAALQNRLDEAEAEDEDEQWWRRKPGDGIAK